MSDIFAVPKLEIHSRFDNQTYHITDRLTRQQMLSTPWGQDESAVSIVVTIPIPHNKTNDIQMWVFEIIEEDQHTGITHTMMLNPIPYTSVALDSDFEDVQIRLILKRGGII